MKREIKFRGKDILTDKWAYGDLLHLGDVCAIIRSSKNEKLKVSAITDQLEFEALDIYGVIPETVGQFTGLLDKNGKEIYEGDIILERLKRARKDGEFLKIVFGGYEWRGENKHGSTISLSLLNKFHKIEVIGNIHDNPELLKGGAE